MATAEAISAAVPSAWSKCMLSADSKESAARGLLALTRGALARKGEVGVGRKHLATDGSSTRCTNSAVALISQGCTGRAREILSRTQSDLPDGQSNTNSYAFFFLAVKTGAKDGR